MVCGSASSAICSSICTSVCSSSCGSICGSVTVCGSMCGSACVSVTRKPSFSVKIRCICSATLYSCVTTINVVFIVRFRFSRMPIISSSVLESRFPVGSSAKMTDGSVISDRAILTRCCCPRRAVRGTHPPCRESPPAPAVQAPWPCGPWAILTGRPAEAPRSRGLSGW